MASLVLLPVLGVTWVLGVFAVNSNTTVFAWLFTIFNSLQVCIPQTCCDLLFTCIVYTQGAFILIFHVLRSDKVRKIMSYDNLI